jgi:parvulin-like peptidyl-prolyl isomerase
MLDRFDRLLALLQRRRTLVLAFAGTLVVLTTLGFVLRGGDDKPSDAVPAGAVATVGDQTISRSTFDHWLGVYRRSGVGGAKPTAAAANTAVLRILVAASWTEQEAAKLGVEVSDAQVDQSVQAVFSTAKAQGISRAAVLQQVGGTEADLRWEQRSTLLGQGLQNRAAEAAAAPTAAEIAAQYEAEPERWAKPSRRDVRLALAADRATAGRARATLAAGKSVAGVRTLTGIVPARRNAEFERAVFGAPVHEVVGPVPVGAGFMVFEVLRSTPLPARPLAKATPTLRSELTALAQQSAVAAYLTSFRRSWRARTTCATALRDKAICANS